MRALREIIVHCTATPKGRPVSKADLYKWHVKERGWSDIGYHYMVHLDGKVEKCRPLSKVGAHVAGHNRGTIGIVYVGGTDADDVKKGRDTRTNAQRVALEELMLTLLEKYPSIKRISGHNDYANKACPCFDARQEYAHLLRKPVMEKKAVARSRTVVGASVASAAGVSEVGSSIMSLADTAESAQDYLMSGETLQLLIGASIMIAGLYVVYSRWDDAGRPSLSKVVNGMFGGDAAEYSKEMEG